LQQNGVSSFPLSLSQSSGSQEFRQVKKRLFKKMDSALKGLKIIRGSLLRIQIKSIINAIKLIENFAIKSCKSFKSLRFL